VIARDPSRDFPEYSLVNRAMLLTSRFGNSVYADISRKDAQELLLVGGRLVASVARRERGVLGAGVVDRAEGAAEA